MIEVRRKKLRGEAGYKAMAHVELEGLIRRLQNRQKDAYIDRQDLNEARRLLTTLKRTGNVTILTRALLLSPGIWTMIPSAGAYNVMAVIKDAVKTRAKDTAWINAVVNALRDGSQPGKFWFSRQLY